MTKEDWIRKLVSRKFWMALAGLVTGLVAFLQHPTTDAQAITSLIMAFGSVVAYIIAEGLVDAAHVNDDDLYEYIVDPEGVEIEPEEKPPEE